MRFLRKAWAFFKKDALESLSYKSAYAFKLFGIFTQIIIFFFIGKLVGSGAQNLPGLYDADYFPFVLVGIAFAGFQVSGLHSFSNALGREQGTGTLEAILITPTKLHTVLLAGSFWQILSTLVSLLVYFAVGAVFFKFPLAQINILSTVLISLLSLTALSGFGLLSAAFLLVFKQGNPIDYFFNAGSKFLAGVYFPVAILPAWVQGFSWVLPLTHALHGLRKAMLQGARVSEVSSEIGVLLLFSVVMMPLGILAFRAAVRKAKRDASLPLL